jgi:RNA polymerase sigma-70 factor (ECF subfamily)
MSGHRAPHEHDRGRDAERMRRIAAGDRGALAELVHQHQARVLATAYRFLGDWGAAEDVAQETFLRVFRAAPDYQPRAAFTTWLYRLVVNRCWDRRRRQAREKRLHASLPPASEVTEPPAVEQAERSAQIRRAVAALPDRQRLAVILHRFDGLSHKEIGEVTGWSRGAVESCLVRAYASLRKSLQDLLL